MKPYHFYQLLPQLDTSFDTKRIEAGVQFLFAKALIYKAFSILFNDRTIMVCMHDWNDTIWKAMVEKSIVHRDGGMTSVFKNGAEIKVGV